MTEKVKFVSVKRTICPKTQLHYLDAISDDGEYYTAVMSPHKEEWLVYIYGWRKAGQMPYK
jgi:hypothetical protein